MSVPSEENPSSPLLEQLEYPVTVDRDEERMLIEVSAREPNKRIGIGSAHGVITMDQYGYRTASIDHVIVVESHRSGVGTKLVVALAEEFRGRGMTEAEGVIVSEAGLRTMVAAFGKENLWFPEEPPGTSTQDVRSVMEGEPESGGTFFKVWL